MEEAENICDYVAFIDHGQKICENTPGKILDGTKTSNLRDAFFEIIRGNYEI